MNETWIKDPPNILMFNLNRVKYDAEKQTAVKDCRRFEFDK